MNTNTVYRKKPVEIEAMRLTNAELRQALVGLMENNDCGWIDVSYQVRMNEHGEVEIRNAKYNDSNDDQPGVEK